MQTENEALLREALKHKGIGPKGSKQLSPDELRPVLPLLREQSVNLTTAACFWTACFLLDNSAEEEALLAPLKEAPATSLRPELQALLQPGLAQEPGVQLVEFINQLIHRQHLNREQAEAAMTWFWHPEVPSWIKATFLQAERINRESFTENLVFLDSLWKRCNRVQVNLPILIDLADSYDGSNRSYHLAPFVAATLAAMGIPTLVHGAWEMPPKYGITNAQVLSQCDFNTVPTPRQVAKALCDPRVGWGYLDQEQAFPELHALKQLRHDMVKRPFLATFEKLLQPIQNSRGNVLFTGYVHAHYKLELVTLMAVYNQCRAFFNLRSIEGSTNCWGKKPTAVIGYSNATNSNLGFDGHTYEVLDDPTKLIQNQGRQLLDQELNPADYGFHNAEHSIDKEISAQQIAQAGMQALSGKRGLVWDLIAYHAAMFYHLAGVCQTAEQAAAKAVEALQSGQAHHHFEAARMCL